MRRIVAEPQLSRHILYKKPAIDEDLPCDTSYIKYFLILSVLDQDNTKSLT